MSNRKDLERIFRGRKPPSPGAKVPVIRVHKKVEVGVEANRETLERFKDLGMRASYHYAAYICSCSGAEWRLGSSLEAKARELFKQHPDLHDDMRGIAKGFIWTLGDKP